VEYSETEQIQTGLSIVNPGTAPVAVNLELTTPDGSPTGMFGSVQIAAGGQTAQFLNELFPTLPSGFKGLLRGSAPSPVTVIGLRGCLNERGEFLITTLRVANEAMAWATPSEAISPHIVSGGGYSTQFVLFSTGPGGVALGSLRVLGSDGAPMVSRLSH